MNKVSAVKVSIIGFDGIRTEHEYSLEQVNVAKPVLQVTPSQIVLVEIFDESLEAAHVASLLAIELGDFELDETINQDARAVVDPAANFLNDDEWYGTEAEGLPFSPRFIRVSKGETISWLWLLETSLGQTVPVLVDESGIVGARQIASHSWFTDSDVPVTWSGEAGIYELPNVLYLQTFHGDEPGDPVLTMSDGSESQLLGLLEDFCLDEARELDVAISFGWDSLGNLRQQDRDLLQNLLERHSEYSEVSLEVDDFLLEKLKVKLCEKSEIFGKLTDLFEDPSSEINAPLLSRFQEVAMTGFVGALNGSYLADGRQDGLRESDGYLIDGGSQTADLFQTSDSVFQPEPHWVVECRETLDEYYFSKTEAKPFWARNSDLLKVLDQLSKEARHNLGIVAEALTAHEKHEAREALQIIAGKFPEISVLEILARIGSHTPKAT